MKCKIIFNTETVPTFEDFEKANEYIFVDSFKNSISTLINYSNHGYLLNEEQKLYKLDKGWNIVYLGKLFPSKSSNSLTFETLRKANIQRLPEFKNSKGEPAHSKEDGSDWSPAQWLQAVIGELGEYANVMKKVERGDLTFEEAKPLIEKELADVMTYLDILAFRVGVDLSKAVEQKFNEVSERVGCSLRIENNEVMRKETPQSYCGTGQLKPKMTDEEFKAAKQACKIPREQVKEFQAGFQAKAEMWNDMFKQMYRRKWIEENKQFAYPLEVKGFKVIRDQIIDLFGLEFQDIDTLKTYTFFQMKKITNAFTRFIFSSYLFEFLSKQLGTKIVGMLINGSKENTKLNPGDMIQFYDDRNILWNFRLMKASEKNVEISTT